MFLVPAALFLAPSALAGSDFAGFVTNFAFYAVFSAIISTALAKIKFAMGAPELKNPDHPQKPQNKAAVEFENGSFTFTTK